MKLLRTELEVITLATKSQQQAWIEVSGESTWGGGRPTYVWDKKSQVGKDRIKSMSSFFCVGAKMMTLDAYFVSNGNIEVRMTR